MLPSYLAESQSWYIQPRVSPDAPTQDPSSRPRALTAFRAACTVTCSFFMLTLFALCPTTIWAPGLRRLLLTPSLQGASNPMIDISSLGATFSNTDAASLLEARRTSWENLKGGEHCLRFATREYTARLSLTDPAGAAATPQEAMRACRETPVEIHGRLLSTDFCQDLGFGRGVYGFWIVDFEEPACETKWGDFSDLGCTNTFSDSGTPLPVRRLESRLENLQPGSNWQIMCVTTPAEIYGHHFGSPAACFNDVRSGVFGEWDMHDSACGGGQVDADHLGEAEATP